jgi:hypothetical protein
MTGFAFGGARFLAGVTGAGTTGSGREVEGCFLIIILPTLAGCALILKSLPVITRLWGIRCLQYTLYLSCRHRARGHSQTSTFFNRKHV